MKNIKLLIILALIISSCGNENEKSFEDIIQSNNLQELKEKRTEIDLKQQEIASQLEQLNTKIASLDTIKNLPLVTTVG